MHDHHVQFFSWLNYVKWEFWDMPGMPHFQMNPQVCLVNHPAMRDSERCFAACAASAAVAALHVGDSQCLFCCRSVRLDIYPPG